MSIRKGDYVYLTDLGKRVETKAIGFDVAMMQGRMPFQLHPCRLQRDFWCEIQTPAQPKD
jgi:hypothetical protein